MQLEVPLAKDETVQKSYTFSHSIILSFLKSQFWITNKRLIVKYNKTFLFIPTGSDTVTYPLRQIAQVKTKTNFNFVLIFFAVIFLIVGVNSFADGGLFWFILGVIMLLQAWQTVIFIGSAGTGGTPYSHVPWEADEAKTMINELNQTIAEF